MTTDEAGAEHIAKKFDGGLLAIGLFKLVEAVFFFLVGVGALHFLHSDLGDAAMHVVRELRVDPESHLVSLILDQLDSITEHRLKQIGAATFCYAALRLAEGIGLMLQKVWAEYLTLGVTAAFLPWEIYEIARRPDALRIWLFMVNLAVLGYLIWWLRRRRQPVPQ